MNNSAREVMSAFLGKETGGNSTIWTNGEYVWANGDIIASWLSGSIKVHGVPLVRSDLLKRQVELFKECQAWYKYGMVLVEVLSDRKGK